jgi:type IV fimbrial biogenesis protein FimT
MIVTKHFGRGRATGKRWSLEQGFTLLELMVTIAVMAILVMIAVPNLNDAVLGGKLSSYANNLVASAYLARGEAVKRNAVITLCASSDGSTCTGGWEQGWVVLWGTNVLHRQQALSAGLKINADAASISFSPTGVSASTAATLTVCRLTPTVGTQERVVSISATGLPGVKKTTTGSCS